MWQLLCGLGLAGMFLGWNALNHYPPWPAFHLEAFAAAGVGFLALGSLVPGRDGAERLPARPALPLPASACVWLAIGLLPTAQWLLGQLQFSGDAALGLLYGAGSAVAICAGQLHAHRCGQAAALRQLFLLILVSGLFACGVAIGQWFRLVSPPWWAMELIGDRPYGNLAQPNHLGLLATLSIVAAVWLHETGVLSSRISLALVLFLLTWGLLASGSRAAMLGACCLVALWFAIRGRTGSRLSRIGVIAAATVGGIAALHADAWREVLTERPNALRAMAEVGPRELIWRHAVAAIQAHPWAGYGFNQAVAAFREVAATVAPSRNVTYAHNAFLDIALWVGLPGALVMTGLLFRWMSGWIHARPDGSGHVRDAWAVFACWLVLLVQSFLEFPYAHAYFLLPACLLAGAITPIRGLRPADRGRPGPAMTALFIGTGLLYVVTLVDYIRMESDFRALRFEHAQLATAPEHVDLSPPWVLDQLGALNASARIVIRHGMSEGELEDLGRVARRFHVMGTRVDYAIALRLNGRKDLAEAELRVVRSVARPDEFARIERRFRHWESGLTADGATLGSTPR